MVPQALDAELPTSGALARPAFGDLWRAPPRWIWEVLFHAHDRPVSDGDEGNLRSRLLAGAPEALFRQDPPRHEPTAEELALLHAHVDGFVHRVRTVHANGVDPHWWLRWLDKALGGCGNPRCCRPSRFEVAMLDRGWFLRPPPEDDAAWLMSSS